MSWITESNRMKHAAGIALITIASMALLTVLYGGMMWQHYVAAAYVALGVSAAMEFKDVHHANGDTPVIDWDWSTFDWLDVAAGMVGYAAVALVAAALQIVFRTV